MNLKIMQIILIAYLTLVSITTKNFQILSWTIFAIICIASHILQKNKTFSSIENIFYITAAMTPFPYLLALFALYLPFSVFGFLSRQNFLKSYIIGFGVSYIPSMLIYLVSTYLSIPLGIVSILTIFYLLPAVGMFFLRGKTINTFRIQSKEVIFIVIILFFTSFVASGIVNDQSLFISNGVREFSRLQPAIEGLSSTGIIPIYNPGTGQGDATYLWLPPGHISHFFISNFVLKGLFSSILFFNAYSFFILFLSVLSLGLLFEKILNRNELLLDRLTITVITLIIGFNFVFIQKLESIKEYSAFPLAYLILVMILDNPKKFSDFVLLGFFSSILVTIHSAYGVEIIVIAFWLFLFRKFYYIKDRSEIKQTFTWIFLNKTKILAAALLIFLLPIFYLLNGVIYKDFVVGADKTKFNFFDIPKIFTSYSKNYYEDHLQVLSLSYPDVRRNDDHKSGPFLSVFGVISFFSLILLYKSKRIGNFRIFAAACIFQFLTIASFLNVYSYQLGGLFRTAKYALIILLGASILVFIGMFENKKTKSVLIAIAFIAFLHMVPYTKQNLNNIHQEFFMSGNIYKEEIDFIKLLPIDGRIITYGLFGNAIDYGGNQLTKRYFSREDWEVLEYHNRNIYNTKIHSSHSFGESDFVLNKSSVELHNYMRLGGYRYIFANMCHPIGNFIVSRIYPDYSKPIYQNPQNGCMVIFIVNDTNYAEKVSVLKNTDNNVYKDEDGYKYFTLNNHYNFGNDIHYSESAAEPVRLSFERPSATEVRIHGSFDDNSWISFKETYWPRWKAYMEGKEVPIYVDNNEQILVNTVKGTTITLRYSVLPLEKIFGILSMVGFAGLGVFFLFLLRAEKKLIA